MNFKKMIVEMADKDFLNINEDTYYFKKTQKGNFIISNRLQNNDIMINSALEKDLKKKNEIKVVNDLINSAPGNYQTDAIYQVLVNYDNTGKPIIDGNPMKRNITLKHGVIN